MRKKQFSMDHMDHMDHMDAVMQKSPFCPSGPPGPSMTNALFPARVDGSWGTVFTAVSLQALREEFSG